MKSEVAEVTQEWSDFIPGTIERQIAPDIFFRPLRSWHSLTFAGEGLKQVNGDRSGCLQNDDRCSRPLVVTHRVYWNKKTGKRLSAFLSYPHAMGSFGDLYFWELYPVRGDIRRFATEKELEQTVKRLLKPEKVKPA